jgi:histidinol-phosphate aminotransferase
MTLSIEETLQKILRPHIQQIVPYATARDEFEGDADIYLDANENPYGSVTETAYNRYPDPYQKELKQKVAAIKKISPEHIFLGNGSDEAIDLLIRMSCEPGKDEIIIMPPTYGMYQVSADINNVKAVKVPLTPDFQLDTKSVLDNITPDTKIIWICSPNNPTGNLLDRQSILQILQNFDKLVVIDEAYVDFSPESSWIEELENYPNLVVLQTFSKAWGLANLRVGMAFANEMLIKVFNKIKAPYNINGLTQQLLTESLSDNSFVDAMVEKIAAEKEKLIQQLQKLPLVKKVYPSDANFLLVKFDRAAAVFHYLIEKKIIVRDRSKVRLTEGCLRISIGTVEENMALVEAIRHFTL